MPRNFCISIGVRKSGNLDALDAAHSDARRFADWARDSHSAYETFLITDEEEAVTIARLKTLTKLIVAEYPARLIVFYSGHGIAGQSGDKWLLSNYSSDGDEAVNVDPSMRNARRLGIGQVAIFSDACRTSISEAVYVQGSTIFGTPAKPGLAAPYDEFFSTDLRQPAQEVQGALPHGIFTECLLKAFRGPDLGATEIRDGRIVVSSVSLAEHLEDQVPYASGLIENAVIQQPSITVSWRRPNDLYVEVPAAESYKGGIVGSATTLDADTSPSRRLLVRQNNARNRAAALKSDKSRLIEQKAQNFANENATAFPPGFTEAMRIVGAEVSDIVMAKGRSLSTPIFELNELSKTAAVSTSRGLVIGQRYPGFRGTLVLGVSGLESVNYTHIDPSFALRKQDQRSLSAEWSALLSIHRTLDKARLNDFASRIRQEKHQNPALGILAGYAYERAGNLDQLANVAWYFADRNGWVPFDLMLLLDAYGNARDLVADQGSVGSYDVIGHFPLNTRGWSLVNDDRRYEFLRPLSAHLLDAVWTTFEMKAASIANGFVQQRIV
ncbi:caspase family protein [Phyllobacterium chamaecytisi]|uniref:caspase family protein n=1 Tax=Phyllobacterium chamaecytisi TaxID=2876082 RepID=UPI001CCD948C|nr:caspase family protein [Phyllobacterium sp. KW56]MBZ9603345.1 caspase family protein [Phyllobacterium sp. KW56]